MGHVSMAPGVPAVLLCGAYISMSAAAGGGALERLPTSEFFGVRGFEGEGGRRRSRG